MMTAAKFITLTSLIVLLCACKSEDQKNKEGIVGTWRCIIPMMTGDGGPPMELTARQQYLKNSSSSGSFTAKMQEPGVTARFEFVMSGSWETSDGNLVETLEKVAFVGAAINDAPITDGQLRQAGLGIILDSFDKMEGTTAATEILSIDDNRMSLYDPLNEITYTCTRQ